MRQPQFEDTQYIVNLTQQLVRSNVISHLKSNKCCYPDALYLYLYGDLSAKVRGMRSETLGLICSYGFNKDFSEPLCNWSGGFIRKTGIEEVIPNGLDSKKAGRELLELLAIATIVSVACDIIKQDEYEESRRRESEFNEAYDRGMRNYVHRGNTPGGRLRVPTPSIADLREGGDQ